MLRLASIVGALVASLSVAQAWPDQPIRMVVAFAPGGTTDVMARIVADRLGTRLGQRVYVENLPGAGGNSGAAVVAKSEPNGYIILMATPGQAVMNQYMYSAMPYDTASFVPLAYVASVPSVLVVSPTLDVTSTQDFLSKMKARQGGANYGSAGAGSTGHLGGTLLSMATGLTAQHIPYRGSAPMLQDLMAGNIQFAIDTVPGVMGYIAGGSMKALAITGKSRSPALPSVPNNQEAGIPEVEMASWLVLLAPSGTPRSIIDKINAEANAAVQDPQLRDRILKLGAIPEGGSPEDVAAFLRNENTKWKNIIEKAHIKIE